MVNVVVWPDLMEKYRKAVMGARLMEVRGRVEYDDEVIHLIAAHLSDASHALQGLSGDVQDASVHSVNNSESTGAHRYPRNVRIIPKSRDFH